MASKAGIGSGVATVDRGQVFFRLRTTIVPFSFRERSRARGGGECGKRAGVFQGLWEALFAFHQSVISTAVCRCLRFFFGFFGLFDSVARDVELEDDAVVDQAVNGCCRGHGIFENSFPFLPAAKSCGSITSRGTLCRSVVLPIENPD